MYKSFNLLEKWNYKLDRGNEGIILHILSKFGDDLNFFLEIRKDLGKFNMWVAVNINPWGNLLCGH